MIGISKAYKFEAAHVLPQHPGKCSRLHGHSYRLRVSVIGQVNPETGFVLDYNELDKIVDPIVEKFDHTFLNWWVRYPSAENIAIHIAHLLRLTLRSYHYVVSVSETQKTWASWDSRSKYCQSIFIHCELDSFDEDNHCNMDAGWRSPDLGEVAKKLFQNTSTEAALEVSAQVYDSSLQNVIVHGQFMTQHKLYLESMGKPGAIQDELKALGDQEWQKP